MAPLIFAHGAGAVSRFNIGVTIFFGMAIGTLFTLFVTPAVYTFLARDHAAAMAKEKALGHLREKREETREDAEPKAEQKEDAH
jgi:H+/gluconate symporter-like permease